jgi:hypothetical protein
VPRADRPAALAYYSFATYPASMRSRQLVERWALKAGALSAAVREFVELLIRITRAAEDEATPEIHWAIDFRARNVGPVAV